MKILLKSMLAAVLCAAVIIAGISTGAAYAAEKEVPVKVTFNKKNVTVTNKVTVKSLKKKWGKPQKETNDRSTIYSWKKGKTSINYFDYSNAQMLEVNILDKNGKMFGVKVGMKKDAALKNLKKTYGVKKSNITSAGEEGKEALQIPVPSLAAWVYFENEKVSGMYYQASVK